MLNKCLKIGQLISYHMARYSILYLSKQIIKSTNRAYFNIKIKGFLYMQNQDVIALLSDPEVRKLLTKLSKNETVNAVLSNNNEYSGPYYPQNYNNNHHTCQCHNHCDNNIGLGGFGGLGLLFLLPLLGCGFGGGCGCGFGGFGRGFGGCGCGGGWKNCCSDCCCCDFWC